MNDATNDREEALALYSGPRRTYEIFSLVAAGPKAINEILEAVPGDEEFIRSIVRGMVEDDLFFPVTDEGDAYELSDRGRAIKETLDSIPQSEKSEAYQAAWGVSPPDRY